MIVKVCGITSLEDALFCAKSGADYLGFIFFKKSKRYLDPIVAKEIIKNLPQSITPVGVFVNEEIDVVNSISNSLGLKKVQLHGEESPEYCNKCDKEAIKAFGVDQAFVPEEIKKYKVSTVLLDTLSNGQSGGTGKTFDWTKAIEVQSMKPVILAGGLNISNIKKAIETVDPFGVDINSGVEISPGIKDHNKVKKIMALIKDAS